MRRDAAMRDGSISALLAHLGVGGWVVSRSENAHRTYRCTIGCFKKILLCKAQAKPPDSQAGPFRPPTSNSTPELRSYFVYYTAQTTTQTGDGIKPTKTPFVQEGAMSHQRTAFIQGESSATGFLGSGEANLGVVAPFKKIRTGT